MPIAWSTRACEVMACFNWSISSCNSKISSTVESTDETVSSGPPGGSVPAGRASERIVASEYACGAELHPPLSPWSPFRPPCASAGGHELPARTRCRRAGTHRSRHGGHGPGDHPVVLSQRAGPPEAVALEQRDRAVVQKRRGHRPALHVLGVALHRAAAQSRDLVQGTVQRDGGDSTAPVSLVDEEAGDPPVRKVTSTGGIGAAVLDARQL